VGMNNIHKQFVQLGHERRRLTNKLLSLLPEIYEKEIFKKYCETIYEYAGKFGGLSKSVVQKTLRLERHLEGKPELKKLISTQGVHKVAIVATLASPETSKVWAEKVEHMSKGALQTLATEKRTGETPANMNISLNHEMQILFFKLKEKMGKNLSNKEVLKRILKQAVESLNPKKRKSKPQHKAKERQKTLPGENFHPFPRTNKPQSKISPRNTIQKPLQITLSSQ